MKFSLGVNYWPRRSAMAMWRKFDLGEIREDFFRISALGFDTVRFFLRWDAFQPQIHAIDQAMLDRLVSVVEAAASAKLETMPTLFCGHMSGVNWLPSWTLDAKTPAGRFRTITESGESPLGIGDFYTGALLEAQVRFAGAIAERLKMHPNVVAWDLGNEFTNMREPATSQDAANWSARLCETLEHSSAIPVTAARECRMVRQLERSFVVDENLYYNELPLSSKIAYARYLSEHLGTDEKSRQSSSDAVS